MKLLSAAEVAAAVAAHARVGVNPRGRVWDVSLYTSEGFYVGTIEAEFVSKANAELFARWQRKKLGAPALGASIRPNGAGVDALFAAPSGDREAAIREAVGLLRDLERVIPSARISEVLAKLAT